jgi:beta-lactamase class A
VLGDRRPLIRSLDDCDTAGASIAAMPWTRLRSFVDSLPHEGSFSVSAGRLDGPPEVSFRERQTHDAASMMKLAVVLAAYREAEAGRVHLDERVVVHNRFTSVTGSGTFGVDESDDSDEQPWRRMGSRVALRWLACRSWVRSSNLATNLLLEAVGLDPVAAVLESVGAVGSAVTRGIDDRDGRDAGFDNVVTARDLVVTLQALANGDAAGPQACQEMMAILAAQQINDAIPARLPPGVRVAHKSGWDPGISHDAGIVYPLSGEPFAFAMCTTSGLSAADALDLIATGAQAAWTDAGQQRSRRRL